MAADINPKPIAGPWSSGVALDVHTLSSIHLGYDEYGHDRWENTRSPVGELLYRLKFGRDQKVLPDIVDTVIAYLQPRLRYFDVIVPVPPSNVRAIQPVTEIARALAAAVDKPFENCLVQTRAHGALKSENDPEKRRVLLDGLFTTALGGMMQSPFIR